MKTPALFVAAIVLFVNSNSQNTEFDTYKNGLIYSPQTMSKLTHIVDSLNLKFKTCDLNRVFYSKSQAVAHAVRMEKGNIKQAKKDMDSGMAFDEFIKKYPSAEVDKDVLVVKFKYKNYRDKQVVEFSQIAFDTRYGMELTEEDNPKIYDRDFTRQWFYRHYEKSQYSEESLSAFFFPEGFVSKPLPKQYALMIGYADCLIDTTVQKFKEKTEEGWVELPKNWESLSLKRKQNLLDEMRGTRVIGFCSMDSRPRTHAMNIAVLSAETTNWEVFLRAHLDIMNDRFERMSDGSYAWGRRNTYIRELEELNINVSDLVFGISLRTENPAANHYYGSINRIGRALSETKNAAQIETAILDMIKDPALDDYNRALAYFLFDNYNYYIKDEKEKKENTAQLKAAVEALPVYIKSQIKFEEK